MESKIIKIITSYNLQQFREMFHSYGKTHLRSQYHTVELSGEKMINTDRL